MIKSCRRSVCLLCGCLNKKVKNIDSKLLSLAINEITGIVFSEWKICFTDFDDHSFVLEEVSVQHWKDGEIFFERFYYKDIQLTPTESMNNLRLKSS